MKGKTTVGIVLAFTATFAGAQQTASSAPTHAYLLNSAVGPVVVRTVNNYASSPGELLHKGGQARSYVTDWFWAGAGAQGLTPYEILCFLSWESRTDMPKVEIYPEDRNRARILLNGLPTEYLRSIIGRIIDDDKTWYRAVIQASLTSSQEPLISDADLTAAIGKLTSQTSKSGNLLKDLAKELGKGSAQQKRVARKLESLVSDLQVGKEIAKYKGKVLKVGTLSQLSFLLTFVANIAEDNAISDERAAALKLVIDYAESQNFSIDPDFAAAVHEVLNVHATDSNALLDALLRSLWDVGIDKSSELATRAILVILQDTSREAGSAFVRGSATRLASWIGSAQLGTLIGSIAFNTGELYDCLKENDYAIKATDQFANIATAAGREVPTLRYQTAPLGDLPLPDSGSYLGNPSAAMAFAQAVRFQSLSVAHHRASFAKGIEKGRLGRVIADLLYKLFGEDSTAKRAEDYWASALAAERSANNWIQPETCKWLVPLYKSPEPKAVVSGDRIEKQLILIQAIEELKPRLKYCQSADGRAVDTLQENVNHRQDRNWQRRARSDLRSWRDEHLYLTKFEFPAELIKAKELAKKVYESAIRVCGAFDKFVQTLDEGALNEMVREKKQNNRMWESLLTEIKRVQDLANED